MMKYTLGTSFFMNGTTKIIQNVIQVGSHKEVNIFLFRLFCEKRIISTTLQLLTYHGTLCDEEFQIQLLKGLCLLYYNIKDSSQLCRLKCFLF
jgi:hypothetical protein